MRVQLAIAPAVLIVLSACAAQNESPYGRRACGLLACISSPYLKAKLSPSMIGSPVSVALRAAGAPTSSYRNGDEDHLVWRREQRDGAALYTCEERVVASKGVVTSYRFDGNC